MTKYEQEDLCRGKRCSINTESQLRSSNIAKKKVKSLKYSYLSFCIQGTCHSWKKTLFTEILAPYNVLQLTEF